VRDDEQRSAPSREVARQPVHALDVEVVGGLVQQQQLGRIEQQTRQRHAPALPAGESCHGSVHALGEALDRDAAEQPVEHAAKRPVGRPFALGATADERLADRGPLVELVALTEQRRADIAGARERPRVRSLDTGDQAQERRLPAAVLPDHADPLGARHAERHSAQNRAAAITLLDILQIDQVARLGHPLHRRAWHHHQCEGGPPGSPPVGAG
jgi:hypothetical protein